MERWSNEGTERRRHRTVKGRRNREKERQIEREGTIEGHSDREI
jgi:hypothetical protein